MFRNLNTGIYWSLVELIDSNEECHGIVFFFVLLFQIVIIKVSFYCQEFEKDIGMCVPCMKSERFVQQ